ncbi:hypothetical protein HUJ04_005174 [Dendroctonus ponderosae]|nr:hypothetical protein HUJ04_005174 [Dendroctonus ponderosae]
MHMEQYPDMNINDKSSTKDNSDNKKKGLCKDGTPGPPSKDCGLPKCHKMAITETFRQVDSCFNRLQLSGLIEDVQKARAGAAMVLFLSIYESGWPKIITGADDIDVVDNTIL